MKLFNPGFRQRLLLVVIMTLAGFATLGGLSVSALNSQTDAAGQADRLSGWQNGLNLLKIDILIAAAGDNRTQAELETLQRDKREQLDRLAADGVDVEVIASVLDSWIGLEKEIEDLASRIGTSSKLGARGALGEQIQAFEGAMFSNMRPWLEEVKQAIVQMVERRDPASIKVYDASIENLRSKVDELGFLDAFEERINIVAAAGEKLVGLLRDQAAVEHQSRTQLETLLSSTDMMIQMIDAQLQEARDEAAATSTRASLTILIAALAVALVCALQLLSVWRSSTRTLTRTVESLEKIAKGDLQQRLEVDQQRNDDFDRLGSAVNGLTEQLGAVLNRVISSSNRLQTMSSELSGTLDQLVAESGHTEDETGSVAAAVEQISMTVRDMAQASEEANNLALGAHEASEKGGAVITDALGSLEQLAEIFGQVHRELDELGVASSRVDGVTEMINGLAEQTNLLALNAAIEAARAGEAGRGFSVVADEVRALAEKTVNATASINQIINEMQAQMKQILVAMRDGQGRVDSSRSLGDNAALEMDRIRDLFAQVRDRNHQQAASIEEISATAQSIASSMSGVLDTVRGNAERSREIRGFSGQVVEHSDELLGMTGQFRV
ncbi:methyl-accepting chemotaxis protein [Marinobacterium aestuariivivens]|uniref:Methyl-accepting chemotaxis protein n=1 Tax=Marinobacterium aestuariivivens TaxID=1698799 RepID=A0ABW1ZTU9_9GAMM